MSAAVASPPVLGVRSGVLKNLLHRPYFRPGSAGNVTQIPMENVIVDDLHRFIRAEMRASPLQEAYVQTDAVVDTDKSPATCFVSHAHKMRLVDLVCILEDYEMTHPNTFFWLDSLCFNQCRDLDTGQWWDVFQETIAACPTMLVALSGDWIDKVWVPHAPTRPWCVAEFFIARRQDKIPVIGMLQATLEEIKTHLVLCDTGYNFLRHTLNAIDAMKVMMHPSEPPTVSSPNDYYTWENKHFIEGEIQKHMQPILHAVDANNIIREAVLDKLQSAFSHQYKDRPETAFVLGKVFADYGRYDTALNCLKAARASWLEQTDTLNVGVCDSELTQVYQFMGRFDDAERHIIDCVRIRESLVANASLSLPSEAKYLFQCHYRLDHAYELHGDILFERQQFEKSRAAFEKSLSICNSSFSCRLKLAQWWAAEPNPFRDMKNAQCVAQRALADLEKSSMHERDKVIERWPIKSFQAELMIMDSTQAAIDLLLSLLDETVTVQGEQSSHVAYTYRLLCQAYLKLCDRHTATIYADRLYEIQSAELNPEHPDLATALEYRGLCRPEVARESWLRARGILERRGNTHEVNKIDVWLAALPPTAP